MTTNYKKRLGDAMRKAVTNGLMEELGNQAIALIRKRTRLGYGSKNNQRVKLDPLAATTVARRTLFKRRGILSSETSPKRSNLTATGQLLDSLKIIKITSRVATIGADGSRIEGGSNDKVAKHVTDNGRPFLELTTSESNQLAKIAEAALDKALRRI